ncbi:MAG: hypothetical protein WC686_00750 [Candidatus Shapirobacteria bacterium]|jgi:hypothetical protein
MEIITKEESYLTLDLVKTLGNGLTVRLDILFGVGFFKKRFTFSLRTAKIRSLSFRQRMMAITAPTMAPINKPRKNPLFETGLGSEW